MLQVKQCMGLVLPGLWALAMLADAQNYTFTTNEPALDSVTITDYDGPNGDISIPATLGDLPVAPRIRQKAFARAIANLLDNARKYGAEPIAIATRSQGNEVVIDVIDSGPGVPESEVERLKRPFTRLQDARTDASGTGLGLAIVERVARLHGGKFELLNRNEGGLIARLRLPLQ